MVADSCTYCKSYDITATERLSIRQHFHVHTFFSPFNASEKIKGSVKLHCKNCNQNYENLEMAKLDWIARLSFGQVALVHLRTIFPKLDLTRFLKPSNLMKHIRGVTRISKDNFHIIIEVRRKRAFIDCYRYGKPVVAIAVEEIYI